jgi:hypothetical protein
MAPIPNCTNSGTMHNRSFSAVDAAPPKLLPPTDFAADPYYAHIRPPAVPQATQLFTADLKRKLEQIAPQLLGQVVRPDAAQASPEQQP